MRTDYIDRKTAKKIFENMQPINRMICEIAMNTGLRIDDVCTLKREDLYRAMKKYNWIVIVEQKTGKRKKLRLRNKDIHNMLGVCGVNYVFQHRTRADRHRTRQAVWRDMKRSADALRLQGVCISPHSLRKLYAVEQFDKTHDINKVKQRLNHDNISTTMIYVLSRELSKSKKC